MNPAPKDKRSTLPYLCLVSSYRLMTETFERRKKVPHRSIYVCNDNYTRVKMGHSTGMIAATSRYPKGKTSSTKLTLPGSSRNSDKPFPSRKLVITKLNTQNRRCLIQLTYCGPGQIISDFRADQEHFQGDAPPTKDWPENYVEDMSLKFIFNIEFQKVKFFGCILKKGNARELVSSMNTINALIDQSVGNETEILKSTIWRLTINFLDVVERFLLVGNIDGAVGLLTIPLEDIKQRMIHMNLDDPGDPIFKFAIREFIGYTAGIDLRRGICKLKIFDVDKDGKENINNEALKDFRELQIGS